MKKFKMATCLATLLVVVICQINGQVNNLSSRIEGYKNRIQLHPNDTDAAYHLGVTYLKLGDYSNANKFLQSAKNSYVDSPEYHLYMYQLGALEGDKKLMESSYKTYVSLLPWEMKKAQEAVNENHLLRNANDSRKSIDVSSKLQQSVYCSYLMNDNYLSSFIDIDSTARINAPLDFKTMLTSDYIESDTGFDRTNQFVQIDKEMGYSYGPYTLDYTRSQIYITRYDTLSKTLGIYFSKRKNRRDSLGWIQFEKVKFAFKDGGNLNFMHPALTADQQHLIFSTDAQGGYGGYDLWIGDIVGETNIMNLRNMGEIVNTVGDDCYPTINDDMLFYSTNGFAGYGGLDIYGAWLSDDNRAKYSFNMGRDLNSPNDEFYLNYTENRNTGYFTSNRAKKTFAIYKLKVASSKLLIKLIEDNNNPIADVTVKYGNQIGISDSKGEVIMNVNSKESKTMQIWHSEFEDMEIQIAPFVVKQVFKLKSKGEKHRVRVELLSHPFNIPVSNTGYNIVLGSSLLSFVC